MIYLSLFFRTLWQLLAIILVLLAVTISVLKYTLPYTNQYKQDIEHWVAKQWGVDVQIQEISAAWDVSGPAVVLQDISLQPQQDSAVSLSIDEARLKLNLFKSVIQGHFSSSYFVLKGVNSHLDLTKLDFNSAPEQSNSDDQLTFLENILLTDSGHYSIEDSQLTITLDNKKQKTLNIPQLVWQSRDGQHQGEGLMVLPGFTDNALKLKTKLTGDTFSSLAGELFFQANQVDATPWLSQFIADEARNMGSDINFNIWSRVNEGQIKDLQLSWLPSEINWQYQGAARSFSIESGSVQLVNRPNSLKVSTDGLNFNSNGKAWPTVAFAATSKAGQNELYIQKLDLSLFRQFAELVKHPQSQKIVQFQPQGQLNNSYFKWDGESWSIWLKGEGLGWNNIEDMPGAQNLNAEVLFNNKSGRLHLIGEDDHLLTGKLFSKALAYDMLSADIHFYQSSEGWQILSDQLWLSNGDLTLAAELNLKLFEQPAMSLYAEMIGPQAIDARHYYPRGYMPDPTIRYLNRAIQGGRVKKAQVLWHGAFTDFPYRQKQGQFEVRAQVVDATFTFAPQWPALKELEAELVFNNERMDIFGRQGKLARLPLSDNVVVSIQDLNDAKWLDINIDVKQAEPEHLHDLFLNSSLETSVGAALNIVNVQSPVSGQTHLKIGLNNPGVSATGYVDFKKAQVHLTQLGLDFSNVNARLNFDNEKLSIDSASLNWLGLPVNFSLSGGQKSTGYELAISSQSQWQMAYLNEHYPGFWSPYLEGELPLNLDLKLNLPQSGFSYVANLSSNLAGFRSTLPAPYQVEQQQTSDFKLNVKGDQISNLITANWADQLFINAIFDNQQRALNLAHIILGNQNLGMHNKGFDISVDLPEANMDDWIPLLTQIIHSPDENKAKETLFPRLNSVTGIVRKMTFSDVQLNAVNFELQNYAQSAEMSITARELGAEVSIPSVLAQRPVLIEADFLRLNLPSREETLDANMAVINQDAADWLKALPSVRFRCADCKLGRYQLDQVEVDLDPADEGINISRLTVSKNKHQLVAKGRWQQGASYLSGNLNSKDIGELTDEYQITSSIKDSSANIEFDLSWQGAPYLFNTATLDGELDWRLGPGHLSEVSDRGARVLSLLSLDSLVRKLKLDFRDVFSKGFFYNSMQGTMQLQQGIASTSDTQMDGVPADLSLKGYANLNNRTLHYDLAIAPQLTSSIPVIVAWMVNPVTGLAALALDKVIHSARVISEIKFRISGSMDDPQIIEMERISKEIELPQVTKSEKAQG